MENCIVIDMDGTLVNLDKTLIKLASDALNFDLSKADGKTFSYEDTITRYVPSMSKKDVTNLLVSIWSRDGFWRDLEPYEDSIDVINKLASDYKILVCTRIPLGSPNAFSEKEKWIIDHFPDTQVEFFAVSNGAKKGRIRCDYIIEDRLKEIKSCPPETTAIILNRLWNTEHSLEWSQDLKFIRADKWSDINQIIFKKIKV